MNAVKTVFIEVVAELKLGGANELSVQFFEIDDPVNRKDAQTALPCVESSEFEVAPSGSK